MDATAGAPAYSALNARQAQSAVYGAPAGVFSARSGWRVGTPNSVVSVTSLLWTLNPCAAIISPAAVLYQGSYGWATDQAVTGAVTPADGTNPRLDILYIQINDSSAGDGSGALSAPVQYLAGAATATPVAPTLPVRSFLVATIAVPKAGGGAPTVTLNQKFFVAAGAAVPVFSKAERDALTPYASLSVIRLDVPGAPVQIYDGTAWKTQAHNVKTMFNNTSMVNQGGTASRMVCDLGSAAVPYDRIMTANAVCAITPASIATGVSTVYVSTSLMQSAVSGSQGYAPISWTAPGSYILGAFATTGEILVPAGTVPLARLWVNVITGSITTTVSADARLTQFWTEEYPA
jgi:hypothetical protein